MYSLAILVQNIIAISLYVLSGVSVLAYKDKHILI